MKKSTTSILLTMCAIVGSIIGYYFTVTFIVEIPFWKYMLIELVLSLLHAVYNYTKQQALENITQ
jgi:uncharacterized protein (DUF983 family)